MPFDIAIYLDYFWQIVFAVRDLWWLWLFIILFEIARSFWLSYAQSCFKKKIKWVMFEIRIPREVQKNPRAMEQVFLTVHSLRNSPSNMKEKWWDGEVGIWFSFEIVSFGGELHFYLRVPDMYRNILEASFYAHYANIEIVPIEDYVNRLPSTYETLKEAGYEMFGNELLLAKADGYPIKTYMDFESIEEQQQIDPIGALLEVLAKLKPQDQIWMQIVIRPADDSWKKEGEKLVQELKDKMLAKPNDKDGKVSLTIRSPGELEILKSIERNMAKPAFETVIRYLYISPKDAHDMGFGRRSVLSALNQYASESLNKFKNNPRAWTLASIWGWPHFFPTLRSLDRKRRIYASYRQRKMPTETLTGKVLEAKPYHWAVSGPPKGMVLNSEELATIYHPPTQTVLTGPIIRRMESTKAGPPAGLPIYGEGSEKLPIKHKP